MKPASEGSQDLKFVYHKLDRDMIRSMVVLLLGAAAEMNLGDFEGKITPAYAEHLVKKADILGELGGAKISFIFVTILRDLFINVMKLPTERVDILMEIIFTMSVDCKFRDNTDAPEGPKRDDKQPDQ